MSPRPPTLWARISKYIYIESLSDEEDDNDETRPLATAAKGPRRGGAEAPSLPEAYHSVHIPTQHNGTQGGKMTWALWWRKLLAYVGPGYMVAVGYMDPGNWATDLAGGAQFGYDLLCVVLLACILAMFLQVHIATLHTLL
jgi:manganese transport protein